MKKTYIKPQLWVMATATNELLQTSWGVYSTNGGEPGKDDRGKIIYDHCCPVKIVKYHLGSNSRNSVLDIQALI